MRSVDIKAALQYHVFGCPGIANVLATGRLGEESVGGVTTARTPYSILPLRYLRGVAVSSCTWVCVTGHPTLSRERVLSLPLESVRYCIFTAAARNERVNVTNNKGRRNQQRSRRPPAAMLRLSEVRRHPCRGGGAAPAGGGRMRSSKYRILFATTLLLKY